ncbi:MAG: glycosyltransferase family 2 protein, partial [Eubacteriales bacterium]
TLISKKALNENVNFSEIYNISFWGEDRHFSIRATAIGFKLFVDTTYPAYHIYRQSNLQGIEKYKNNCITQITDKSPSNYPKNNDPYITLIEYFIKDFYYCDYRIATGYECLKHLSPKYVNKFLEKHNSIINFFNINKTMCKATPLNTEIIKSDQDAIEANVNFEILNNEKDANKAKVYFCHLILRKLEQTKWLVDFISLKNSQNEDILGFTLPDLLEGKVRTSKSNNNQLTLMMLVRNEADKYLERVLSHAAQYIDNAIILDDASDDETVEICEKVLANIPHSIISNKNPGFSNEISLRKQLWETTISNNPDWILCLDADEIFEDDIIEFIRKLTNQPSFDYYGFRLYDMWDESHYREDNLWQAHKYFKIFLTRYQKNYAYTWQNTPQHCGRFPNNVHLLNGCQCSLRLKHLGWSTEKLRLEKYKRYLALDPKGDFGNIYQYRSILSPNPKLIKWN